MYIYIYSHTLDGSEIQNNHLGIPNPSKSWDKLPTTTGEFAGFLVESSTVFTSSSGCFFYLSLGFIPLSGTYPRVPWNLNSLWIPNGPEVSRKGLGCGIPDFGGGYSGWVLKRPIIFSRRLKNAGSVLGCPTLGHLTGRSTLLKPRSCRVTMPKPFSALAPRRQGLVGLLGDVGWGMRWYYPVYIRDHVINHVNGSTTGISAIISQ